MAHHPTSPHINRFWRSSIVGIVSACLLLLIPSNGFCQTTQLAKSDESLVTVSLPTVEQLYSDLRFVFELANDQKGFKTLKESIDVYLVGIQPNKPSAVRLYPTADGLSAVTTFPIKDDADYKKFLENLWDVGLKTAPPPKPALAPQVPKATQTKLKSVKLDSNERILFGLADGFVRYDAGHVQIGETLERVRLAKGEVRDDRKSGESLVVRLNATSHSAADRRAALEKTKDRLLDNLETKKADQTANETEVVTRLRKALREFNVGDIGGTFTESSTGRFAWITSQEKKQALMHAELEATKGSPLAGRISKIGQLPDAFAGISRDKCVATADFNFAATPQQPEANKSAKSELRAAAKARSEDGKNKNRRLNPEQLDTLFDLLDDSLKLDQRNGFLRSWSHAPGTITTVGGFIVPDTARALEVLQKFKGREGTTVELKAAREGEVEIHKLTFTDLPKDAPELVDAEGAVYVGTGKRTVWYAVGEKALDDLKTAIQEAKEGKTKTDVAVDIRAQLSPLAQVWEKLDARFRNSDAETKGRTRVREKEKSKEGAEKKPAEPTAFLDGLDLPKLAVDAFKNGKDTASMTVTRQGEGLVFKGNLDEGFLRFVGLAMAKFVKENLED